METAPGRKKLDTEINPRSRREQRAAGATSISVVVEDTRWRYDFTLGYFEIMQLQGRVVARGEAIHQASATIDISIPSSGEEESQFCGEYSYSPKTTELEAHFSFWLKCEQTDFSKILLPKIMLGDVGGGFEFFLNEKLNPSSHANGNVHSFCFDVHQTRYSEVESPDAESLDEIKLRVNSLYQTIRQSEHDLTQRIDQTRKVAEHGSQKVLLRLRDIEISSNEPKDILSKLFLKIPLVGWLVSKLLR